MKMYSSIVNKMHSYPKREQFCKITDHLSSSAQYKGYEVI